MVHGLNRNLKVVIVGAGIGGLACAIACRQQGLEVVVLERTPEFQPVGAGIQIPANASRVMRQLGIYEKLEQRGAVVVQGHTLRAYNSGHVLARKQAGDEMARQHGSEWMVIHRADYQQQLLEEAFQLGAKVHTDCEVTGVDLDSDLASVKLRTGETVTGDAIIGADGLWSHMRTAVLGFESAPSETGDLAYRGTFSAEQLEQIEGDEIQELLTASDVQVWLGPDKHVVFYPVRNKTEFNLVLLRPDDLPRNVKNEMGSLDEMRESFRGWDPRLTRMIAQLKTALKWKLCHHEELETWVKGCLALLGDSSHPTLPYQAQGAAMAVEDGLVIGTLLGRLNTCGHLLSPSSRQKNIHGVLQLYEKLRKERTTINVKGAIEFRDFYHLPDGEEQIDRDQVLRDFDRTGDWPASCKWHWGNEEYQQYLLGFDVVDDANQRFDAWQNAASL